MKATPHRLDPGADKTAAPRTGSAPKTRILIVDDHPVVRDGFSNLIKRQRDFIRCGEAGTVAETFKAVETLHPDLVLLDLWIGGGDGLDLIKSLKAQFPHLRIL